MYRIEFLIRVSLCFGQNPNEKTRIFGGKTSFVLGLKNHFILQLSDVHPLCLKLYLFMTRFFKLC